MPLSSPPQYVSLSSSTMPIAKGAVQGLVLRQFNRGWLLGAIRASSKFPDPHPHDCGGEVRTGGNQLIYTSVPSGFAGQPRIQEY